MYSLTAIRSESALCLSAAIAKSRAPFDSSLGFLAQPTSHSSAAALATSLLLVPFRTLTTPSTAALGLPHYMRVSPQLVRLGMNEGTSVVRWLGLGLGLSLTLTQP